MSKWIEGQTAHLFDPVTGALVGALDNFGREVMLPTMTTDASGNVTGLVTPGNQLLPQQTPYYKTTTQPWKFAFFGDSRVNAISGATTPDCVGSGILAQQNRVPTWVVAFMGDAEYSRTYAVSGDTAAQWQSPSRASGRTYIDLNTCDSEVVHIQYGVNDAIAGTPAATIAGYLQNFIAECFKSGKLVVFESILPVNSPVASPATAQAIIDSTNVLMQTWLANFPQQAIYVDIATAFKAGGSLASYTYTAAADGLHPTSLGSQLAGQIIANAVRVLLPRRLSMYEGPGSPGNNYINLTSPTPILTQFNFQNSGTATVTQTRGQDSNGFYYEWGITTTSLSGNNESQTVCQMSANFQTANPAYVALQGNEILQGSARLIADDGVGGAPNAYVLNLRQRFYTAAIFNDWCGTNSPPAATDSAFTSKVDIRTHTPKMVNTTASVVASPASGAGLVLQVIVQASALGFTRLRVYNPQLRRVGYSTTPVSSTVGASPAAITNTTNAQQQYIFSGGTVSSITLNAVTTGLTSGVFILNPGDSLVITHTGAPTQVLNQLMTQNSLRGLI